MLNKSLLSSASDEWSTPDDFFRELDQEFAFTLDVCATAENAKCANYYTPEQDGLRQDWNGVVWCNPPYSRIAEWMRKAHEASLGGATVVCLIPSRTDTRYWHDYAARGEIRFVKGRLKFGDATNSAPFPSAIVVLRPGAVPGSVAHVKATVPRRTTASIIHLFEDAA